MIRKISFENYKAFKSGELKLKPITILLGANSVGKSSIINLLLMLQQTARVSNYKSAFKLHGENVSLGECENLFRNKDTQNNIVIDFEFESKQLSDLLQKQLYEEFIDKIIEPVRFLYRFKDNILNEYFQDDIIKFLDDMLPLDDIIITKDMFLNIVNGIEKINTDIISQDKQVDDFIRYYTSRGYIRNNSSRETLVSMYDFLFNLKGIDNNIFNISFECSYINQNDEGTIRLKKVIIKNNDTEILRVVLDYKIDVGLYDNVRVFSDYSPKELLCEEIAKQEFMEQIKHNSTIFSWIDSYDGEYRDFYYDDVDNDINALDTKVVSQILGLSLTHIRKYFTKELVNHVSPLRAHPKRYYFLDNANINTSINTLDGNSLTEVLKENTKVRTKVNEWLKKFGLQVNVSTLQDIIHKLKVRQHSLELDITDVGFGISQILPIIVQGFLSFDNSLTMIEQPEIHLHPKMQADLADLFIDIVKNRNKRKSNSMNLQKYLLIETHSEYLLRRLRRRIAEGKISSEDVAIYFLEHPDDGQSGTIINEKTISSNGYFDWPQDFYAKELLNDTTEFIKQSFRNL